MQDHTAICTRWVGGRRRSKQEVIITLPAAALHLLTTWKNWKKFRNKPNINRCFCTHTFSCLPHFGVCFSGNYFWVYKERERERNDVSLLWWEAELWLSGLFVLKFRQRSRWLPSVGLSKLASCRVWLCCLRGFHRSSSTEAIKHRSSQAVIHSRMPKSGLNQGGD